jgi:hypothetical protein
MENDNYEVEMLARVCNNFFTPQKIIGAFSIRYEAYLGIKIIGEGLRGFIL